MRKSKVILVLLFVVLICSDVLAARRRRGRTYYRTTTSYSGPSELYSGTDQERCEKEAAYMAKHRIFGHVGGRIGLFEGWGHGGPSCATCVPSGNMTCTGDACVGGFRVRSWR